MKLLVDVPDGLLFDAIDKADVTSEELAIDGTTTDAVLEDALRAFVAIDGARDVLDERPDLADARTTGERPQERIDDQWRTITDEEASKR